MLNKKIIIKWLIDGAQGTCLAQQRRKFCLAYWKVRKKNVKIWTRKLVIEGGALLKNSKTKSKE